MEVSAAGVKLLNGKSLGWQVIDTESRNPWADQVEELVGWIEGRKGHRGEGRQARWAVEVMMGLYQSARNHEVVRMPLRERGFPLELMIAEGKIPVEEPGRYDIREFLTFGPEGRKRYQELRSQGWGHREVLRAMGREGSKTPA